jgi:chromate transport protein ChrA
MSLWKLTLLIALFNLMTFGNGPVMIPLLRGYEHLRYSGWIKRFTKGLTVTSVGLILAAMIQIAHSALTQT